MAPQYAEPTLDLVEPRGVGGGVMEMYQGVSGEPTVMLGFMDVEIVQDNVEFCDLNFKSELFKPEK